MSTFHLVDCNKMSFSDRKSLEIIYRRIESKNNRAPKTEDMRRAMSFSKVKLMALTACIIGGGAVIPLIWFSLIGVPFMVKSENKKWERIFPKERDQDVVLLSNK